jgi:hypothetical protein
MDSQTKHLGYRSNDHSLNSFIGRSGEISYNGNNIHSKQQGPMV